jgi:hypothetical protein
VRTRVIIASNAAHPNFFIFRAVSILAQRTNSFKTQQQIDAYRVFKIALNVRKLTLVMNVMQDSFLKMERASLNAQISVSTKMWRKNYARLVILIA